MTTFGEIRSMLHSPSTDDARIEAWEELLKVLMQEYRGRREEVSEEWLPYVMAVLDQQWPDEARVAPREWVNKIGRGLDPHPLMPLVRAIDVRRKPNPSFVNMCHGTGFEWVRHMTFGSQRLKLGSVQALAQAETFSGLTSLTLHSARLGLRKITTLAGAPFADNLVRLRLPFCELKDNSLQAIVKHMGLERLRTLDLRQAPSWENLVYTHAGVGALADAELPKLRDLDLSGWTDASLPERALGASWVGQLERLVLYPANMVVGSRTWRLQMEPRVRDAIENSALDPEVRAETLATLSRDPRKNDQY